MKWKWTVPYLLTCAVVFVGSGLTTAQSEHDSNDGPALSHNYTIPYNATLERGINEVCLDNKADNLRDKYVANMLNAQEKLHPLMGRSGYSAAVRAELPGAPVGQHCVYGQYTHLSRALDEMGDTLTIIPVGGHASCVGFKYHMNKKYNTPEFPDCIHNGVMHESDSTYNVALNKYLTRNKVGLNTHDSIRRKYTEKFATRNFSADGLDAGSILIVPRFRGSRNTFHAIMYLGRGRIDAGKFVADSTGRHIYVGHNRENIGDIFKTYDMSNVFAADTHKIVRAEYANELKRIETMSTNQLIAFLSGAELSASILATYPRNTLIRMARDRYFNRLDVNSYLPTATNVADQITTSVPMYQMPLMQQLVWDLKKAQKTM